MFLGRGADLRELSLRFLAYFRRDFLGSEDDGALPLVGSRRNTCCAKLPSSVSRCRRTLAAVLSSAVRI